MAAFYGVKFPDNIDSQLERILSFVNNLQPSGIYRPSAVYKKGGKGMKELRAARQPQSDNRRAECVFVRIEPRPSRNGAIIMRAGPNHKETYNLPVEPNEIEALLRNLKNWHEEARKNRVPKPEKEHR